uniref:Ig-like domain-containing protein n=1 Tax=Gopherus evgoodei TaxID=1825980 RepID=A0A8C4Y5W7_9SAUR
APNGCSCRPLGAAGAVLGVGAACRAPGQPKVKVSPTKSGSKPHSHLLVCSVTGFYPSGIEIKWLKNGQEQMAGVVATELLQNGDWTFQILVMLDTSINPKEGGRYSCLVDHSSLPEPLNVFWGEERAECLSGRGGGEYTKGGRARVETPLSLSKGKTPLADTVKMSPLFWAGAGPPWSLMSSLLKKRVMCVTTREPKS